MKNKIFLILAIIVLATVSCNDFLTESPKHDWDVDKAMTTYSNAVQSVNGIYGRFMKGDYPNQGYYVSLTTKSGMIKLTNEKDYNFTYNQQGGSACQQELWKAIAEAVNAANFAINGIPKVSEKSFPNSNSQKELIGEARFLRGYLYSIQMLNYCHWYDEDNSPYGLVYRDETSTANNINVPRITVGESWAKIMEDIDFAIANMNDAFATPRKASKFFAKAYKAKLLLIRGTMRKSDSDIAAAKTLVEECISNIPSAVSVESDMAEVYKKSWDSKENIFVRYLEDVAGRMYSSGYWTCYGLGYEGSSHLKDANGDVLQKDALMGLKYGHDWMSEDPRWYIATGVARTPETWDNTRKWIWTKIYRKGRYEGSLEPKDEKYAIYHMRLPELYIMQAELIARTGGSNAEAIAPINKYRAMRTNPVLPQIVVPGSKQELMEIIFQEYVKELILENGTEFWAALRFEKDGNNYIKVTRGADFIFEKNKIQYAIPDGEMINNPALKGMQNPGQE